MGDDGPVSVLEKVGEVGDLELLLLVVADLGVDRVLEGVGDLGRDRDEKIVKPEHALQSPQLLFHHPAALRQVAFQLHQQLEPGFLLSVDAAQVQPLHALTPFLHRNQLFVGPIDDLVIVGQYYYLVLLEP